MNYHHPADRHTYHNLPDLPGSWGVVTRQPASHLLLAGCQRQLVPVWQARESLTVPEALSACPWRLPLWLEPDSVPVGRLSQIWGLLGYGPVLTAPPGLVALDRQRDTEFLDLWRSQPHSYPEVVARCNLGHLLLRGDKWNRDCRPVCYRQEQLRPDFLAAAHPGAVLVRRPALVPPRRRFTVWGPDRSGAGLLFRILQPAAPDYTEVVWELPVPEHPGVLVDRNPADLVVSRIVAGIHWPQRLHDLPVFYQQFLAGLQGAPPPPPPAPPPWCDSFAHSHYWAVQQQLQQALAAVYGGGELLKVTAADLLPQLDRLVEHLGGDRRAAGLALENQPRSAPPGEVADWARRALMRLDMRPLQQLWCQVRQPPPRELLRH